MDHPTQERILILDFGTQYAMLIARRVRELGTYSEVRPFRVTADEIRALKPIGIILSGGPKSVYAANAPACDPAVFALGVPVLGICYGMQLMSHMLGGAVTRGEQREYGHTMLAVRGKTPLLRGVAASTRVWMSHGDQVTRVPAGFNTAAVTDTIPHAAIADEERRLYGVQFHPEVAHTDEGRRMLGNFLDICGARRTWQVASMIDTCTAQVRAAAPDGQIICGLSGGVDSSITAKLIARAAPGRLTCIFVDNGLLRQGEAEQVRQTFADPEYNLHAVDASRTFLERLKGVTDPQQKRAIIGHAFIDVFYAEAQRIPGARFLAQGTLYPDVIESVSAHGGPTDCIKLHHNVGGLPADIAEKFTLIEPLRLLFKDEVRRMGLEFGLPEEIVWRHPFPGPGLAVRIVGEIRSERLEMLRRADAIFMHELKDAGLYRKIGQAFVVFLPVQSVGVMGDERSYENVVVLRSVDTTDYMTADWTRLPYDFLQKVAGRIISEVRGINRVVFDVTSKPPGTIEWE